MSFGGGSAIPIGVVYAGANINSPVIHSFTIPLTVPVSTPADFISDDFVPADFVASESAVIGTFSNTGAAATQFVFTSGNPNGYYAIDVDGNVRVTSAGAVALTTAGTDVLTARASNSSGFSIATVTIIRSTAAAAAPSLSNFNGFINLPANVGTQVGTVINTGGAPTTETLTGTGASNYTITTGGVIQWVGSGATLGTDNLTATASNISGTSTASVTIQRTSAVPVINDVNFQLALVAPPNTTIGTVASAIGSNITYSIISENGAAPTGRYNIVPTTGVLSLTSSGSTAFNSDGTDTLVVRATNSSGSDSATVHVIKLVTIVNGQQMTLANTGRAGAQAANSIGFSATLTTITTVQTYNSNTTIRNTRFTNRVNVVGGNVLFEYCQFAFQPAAADHALQIYNNGNATGSVTCNWCDIDSGLRGTQGNFESCGFQAGERGIIGVNNPTFTGSFLLYRCEIQGFGNGCGFHKWQGQPSVVRECFVANLTSGGGSHGDGFEIYTSDNLTIERTRVQVISDGTAQSCFQPANQDFGNTVNSNPIIIQNNYVNGGIGPFSFFFGGPAGSGSHVRNVKLIGNWFGDSSQYGREFDMGGDSSITPGSMLNMCYDLPYWNANQNANTPGIIYVALDNKWVPNGEGVTDPTTSPSGDFPNGKPHVPGQFVGAANVFGGNTFTWNGSLLGPGTPPVVASIATTLALPVSSGQPIRKYTATNTPVVWRTPGTYDPSGNPTDIAGKKYVTIDNTGQLTVTALGAVAGNLTAGTYTISVQAINGSGPGTTNETITISGAGAAPVVNPAGPFTLPANPGADIFVGNVTATNTPTLPWTITAASDPSNNFAIYLQGDGSANIRTSDGTTAGGGGGPPPSAGTYSLVVQASNASGTSAPRTITVTVQASTIAPVISDISFPLTLNAAGVGAPATTVVGNITASAGTTPITWAITAGNTQGWWTITGTGVTAQITVSMFGSSTSTGITAGSWPLTVRASNAFGQSIATATVVASVVSTTGWPDQTNTGYTNAPGYPGSLTPMAISAVTANSTVSFKFFDAGIGTNHVNVQNVTFIGCQFASNAGADVLSVNRCVEIAPGGGVTTFYYCSMTPRPALMTAPPQGWYPTPGFHWPGNAASEGGGSGGGEWADRVAVQPNPSQTFQYGTFSAAGNGSVILDHCDLWGYGNACDLHSTDINNRFTITNSWVHDARNDSQGDHTDGICDISGVNPPMRYITIWHNTIGAIGNTNAIAMQGPGPYTEFTLVNNYLTGHNGNTVMFGSCTNAAFTDNVYGTDIQWGSLFSGGTGGICDIRDGPLRAGTSANSQWARNTLHIKPGTSPLPLPAHGTGSAWLASDNNAFIWPNATGEYHGATDYTNAFAGPNTFTTAAFTISSVGLTNGQVVGTITGGATTWVSLAASPPMALAPHLNPYFALANSGAITVTASGASNITAGTYKLYVVPVNAGGIWGRRGVVTITVTDTVTPVTPAALPQATVDTTMPTVTGTSTLVHSSTGLQAAINAASLGDEIVLDAGTTYVGPFNLPLKSGTGWVIIRTNSALLPVAGTRVAPADSTKMAKLINVAGLNGSTITMDQAAHHYRLIGLEITAAPAETTLLSTLIRFGQSAAPQTTLASQPHHVVLDRCYVHGFNGFDCPHGVAINSATTAIIDCYISEFHSSTADAQAVWGSNGAGPFLINNSYLEASGENIMFGGADPAIPNLIPSDITFTNNTCFKPTAWLAAGYSIKNLFELKNAKRVLIQNNVFDSTWVGGQPMAVSFKSVNQDGAAPWCQTADVTFRNNTVFNATSGLVIQSNPQSPAALAASRIYVYRNLFYNIGTYNTTTNGVMIGLYNDPAEPLVDVVIDRNTWIHNSSAVGYSIQLDGAGASGEITFTNNIITHSATGIKGSGVGEGGPSLALSAPGGLFSGNVLIGASSTNYVGYSGNFFPATIANVGFVNAGANDYTLLASSPYLGKGY